MTLAGIPAFFALSMAKALSLLAMTSEISTFVISPLAILSMIACRFVPPPLTNTAIFTDKSPYKYFFQILCGEASPASAGTPAGKIPSKQAEQCPQSAPSVDAFRPSRLT